MLDFNTRDLSIRLGGVIDSAMEKKNRQEAPRNYLGASRMGEPCARKLQYEFFNTPQDGEGFNGKTLRIFHRGHHGEQWMAEWLRMAGFELKTEGKDGKQFGFSQMAGRVCGHADGVIVGGPEGFGPFPQLWENKVLGAKGWNKLSKEGCEKSYPVYYAQMQIYMAYLGLSDSPALFTALNADTMEIYADHVAYDPAKAQAVSDRAVSIIRACDAGELMPRLSDDPAWFECKMCGYQQRCHYGK